MKRNKGIITILVGIGLLLISIFFSSGYSHKRDLINNIPQMEIVFVPGEYVPDTAYGHYEGRTSLPLKYPLSLSVVLILLGTGVVLIIPKNKETNA